MAIPATQDATEPAPEMSVSKAVDVLEAAVSPVAAVITAWGKMPRVRTLQEYLARKILGWTAVCGAGLCAGGMAGTVAVAGSVAGLLIDTGVAAWNEHRQPPLHAASDARNATRSRPRGRKELTAASSAAPAEAEA